MSHLLASPPPASLRRSWKRVWDDPDSRSVAIGLLGVVLVHLVIFMLGPRAFMLHGDALPSVIRPPVPREFNIELTPDSELQAQPEVPPPSRFVEANPNAPENIPDRTNNFAAQNQQAAQEKPTTDDKSDRPAMEGRTDIESTQVVSGSLTQPLETMPAPPPEPAAAQEEQASPRQEQVPLSGFDKSEGDNLNAYGSSVSPLRENAKSTPEYIEGAKDAPLVENATGVHPRIDPKRPQPRPQIVRQQQVRPAIFQENKFGTRNIGLAAWDAKWSNYGQYLQKLIDTVQIQWERILIESRVYPVNGTHVKVVFKLNAKGEVSQIVEAGGTAGIQAEKSCVSAITSRAPYGDWTEDMIAVLGEEQELTFNFYYQ
ncbi:MAG TPA: hypothetical protein VNR00_16585 [Opitutus sp.]|nr:hypothetical protein [Opitutus sp.]